MNDDAKFISQSLKMQGFAVYKDDIPYIRSILHTIHQTQIALRSFPNLYETFPITIVDKRLLQ
ncbi:hypothetical protein P5G51_009985 [Virgibacillus sp. 179-BFC.A HS]|uniref:Uncharacterized protein n=1 Tax=Tigheibacillus jepli TaxID=3035914 RepID=A0ABU5CH61_9BACI|nr:hypothetical protein [Virgibacillus sp. 179-BFC.A HS]MDY0405679.1 hypothetical protein [Virgibacillus sp. 179-BFC.A HS]